MWDILYAGTRKGLMARPKKSTLSPAVAGQLKGLGSKRANPDFVSSSFYVPKKINLRFDRAINTLKANDIEVDRSDMLSILMEQLASAVDAAETDDGKLDLKVLKTASETVMDETVKVSIMISQLRDTIAVCKEQQKELSAALTKVRFEAEAQGEAEG